MAEVSAQEILGKRQQEAEKFPGSYVPTQSEAEQMAADVSAAAKRKPSVAPEQGLPTGKPEASGSADPAAVIREAVRRGLLTDDQKAIITEAQRRGLLPESDEQRWERLARGAGEITPHQQVTVKQDPVNDRNILITDVATGNTRVVNKVRLNYSEVIGSPELGPLKDVDYRSGTDWFDLVTLDQADNPEEKRLYLEQKYGKGKVFQDPKGIFYVDLGGGKKVAPGGGSLVNRFSADVAGEGPVWIGATAGAVVGAPLGIPGSVAGAAGGGGIGKSLIEMNKAAFGRSTKSFKQTMDAIGLAEEEMAAAELVGGVLSKTVGRTTAGGLPRWLSHGTPETERLTALATEGGGRPPISSAMPDLKVTRWHQALGEKLTGDMLADANMTYLEKEMHGLLKSAGFTDAEIPELMKDILDPTVANSTAEMGRKLGERYQAYAAGLGEAALAAQQAAQDMLGTQLRSIRLGARAPREAGALTQDVIDQFYVARKEFSRAMQKAYARIDDLVGGQPVVPAWMIKKRAQSLLEKMPESDTKRIIKEIADLPDHITFEDAQRLRTRLAEMGEPSDLAAAGILKRDLRNLGDDVDRSFDQVFQLDQQIALAKTSKAVVEDVVEAAKLLRAADEAYAEGIKKFSDAVMNKVLDAAKAGSVPDEAWLAKTLLTPGNSERIAEFRRMLGKDIWDRVIAQDWRDMWESVSDRGELNVQAFFRQVMKRQQVLRAAYGEKTAAEIESFARNQMALSEKVPVTMLQGDARTVVEAALTAQRRFDGFMEDNFLRELANPDFSPELVYNWIVQPGHESQLERVFDFFGRDSEQVTAIRQAAMRSLLKRAIIKTETGAGYRVGAKSLRDSLKEMTRAQQDMLFPDGLADDINLVADEAQFLFPLDEGDMAAGLAAGAIKAALPFGVVRRKLALLVYGWGGTWNFILSRPAVIRWLALGLSRDTMTRKMTDETFRGIVRAGFLGMLPGQQDND